MQILKLSILILFLWNVPGYLLAYFSPALGSLSSYASSGLLLLYFFLVRDKHKLLIPFILLGVLYFSICSIHFEGHGVSEFMKEFIKFLIVVVCAGEIFHRTPKKEIYLILIVGGLSIIINAVVFPLANANFYPTYGRYSGFYLNPNFAGSICSVGYALSYAIGHKWQRIGGQLIFTLAGIFTFSRTFILVWLIITAVAIYRDKKNLKAPLVGAVVLILVFTFSSKLSLNTQRFNALQSIFGSEKVQTKVIEKDTRAETWALYTDMIIDKPVLGNGYMKMQIKNAKLPGVHNSYLMILGEAGFLPFLLLIGIQIYLLYKSALLFHSHPEYFYISCVVTMSLMVGHGYFRSYFNVLISMFLFIHIRKLEKLKQENEKRPLTDIFLTQ